MRSVCAIAAALFLIGSHLLRASEAPQLPPSVAVIAARGAGTPAEHALLEAAATRFTIPGFRHDKCAVAPISAARNFLRAYSPDEQAMLLSLGPRPTAHKSTLSPESRFRIHYDTTGEFAPEPTDDNGNGIPDYVELVGVVFDSVWHFEIDRLGYPAIPSDNGLGGGNEYDIYFISGDGAYGYTQPDDIELPPIGVTHRYTSYISIHKAFSPEDVAFATHGSDAVRVTAAHEFFHAIQIADYGLWKGADSIETICSNATVIYNRYWLEMSSQWMETIAYPSIRDYLRHSLDGRPPIVNPLFNGNGSDAFHGIEDMQFGITPCDKGYSLMMFWRFAVHQLGGDSTLVKRAWELQRTSPPPAAIDLALREHGRTLSDMWCDFTHGLLFTGARAIDTLDFFPAWEADSLPMMHLRATMSPPIPYMITDSAHVMSAIYYGLVLPSGLRDTLYAAITNRDTTRGSARDGRLQGFRLDVGNGFPSAIPRTTLSYAFLPNETQWCALLTRALADASGSKPPFPDPFLVDGVNEIFFPISASSRPRSVELRIYSESGSLAIAKTSATPETRSGILGVSWNGRGSNGDPVHSGIYLYTVGAGDGPLVGKIAVVRK